jgi:hypothetical protein
VNSLFDGRKSRMNRKTLLGIMFLVGVMGAMLVIFGAVYTVLSCHTDNVLYGYPIWSPPSFSGIQGCGNLTTPVGLPNGISVNYTLNYVGIVIILATIAIPLASWSSKQNIRMGVSND